MVLKKLASFSMITVMATSAAFAGKSKSSDWRDVPEYYAKHFKYNRYMEYDHNSTFLRRFRVPQHPSGKSNQQDTYVRWSDVKLKSDTPADVRECWNIFVSGGECGKPIVTPLPEHYTLQGTLDVLAYSRYVSEENGLRVARDVLVQELAKKDASNGALLERILKTTSDRSYTYPDSFSTIPQQERKDIGVYLVLGIGGEKSANAALIQKAADQIRHLGFQAEMLKVDANLGSDYNSAMLNDMLSERLPKLKKVILVAASKGVADFITFFLNQGQNFPQEQRDKVRLMVSLSGVIRPSMVADFLTNSNRPLPLMIRGLLHLTGKGDTIKGVGSLSHNPWQGHDPRMVKQSFSRMKWLSLPAIPEGPEGVTHLSMWEGFLKTPSYRWNEQASPMDGLVESAASVLPPDTGLTEYIVPVFGPHAIALGSYTGSLRVAPEAMGDVTDRVVPEAGAEMLSALFRALPIELIE